MIAGMMRRSLHALYNRRWGLSRRTMQLFIIVAFAVEFPGIERIAAGNLSSSLWLDMLPLTDPFVMLQTLLAGATLAATALIGAAMVASFYAFFGGRIYCSWVCPINLLTDLAYWLRQRLNIKGNMSMPRQLRITVLIIALLLSMLTATVAWEMINPITLFQREMMWTSAAGVTLLLGLFLFDLLISRRGWCGHLCPVGAFYALLGRYGRLRVTAKRPDACSGCSECIKVCPEPHVLAPVVAQDASSVTSGDCTRCGACLDSCPTATLSMKLQLGKGSMLRGIPVVTED
jgi:ferredoxin-type protein NapH